MAETDVHRKQMIYVLDALEEHFEPEPNVYVTGNIFLYYRDEFGDLQKVAPDIFVVRGLDKHERRIYHLPEEGKAPDFVLELISRETKLEDLGNKRVLYASLGVKEYFIFDPLNEALSQQLRGFRLRGEDYHTLTGERMHSEVLDLELFVENERLRLFDHKTGERLRTYVEAERARRDAERARRAAEAKAKATESKMKAETEARRAAETKANAAESQAKAEAEARHEAEAEVVRLREELKKLQSQPS